MSNTCTVEKSIEKVAQRVADFLARPGFFNPRDINFLAGQIELVAGAVRELPLCREAKHDILGRLFEAQTILSDPRMSLSPEDRLLAVMQLLQLVALKVATHKVPCAQGVTTVGPSCTYNTACHCF